MRKRFIIILLLGMVLLAFLPTTAMAQEEREPLLYGLASFVLPGLGQYLNEEPGKAVSHFLIAVALPVLCYYINYTLPYRYPLYPVCGLLSLGWAAYSGIDAYETAKRFNEMHGFGLSPSQWRWSYKEGDQRSG